jgi:hypothetical protein
MKLEMEMAVAPIADQFKAAAARRITALVRRETRRLEKALEAQVRTAGLSEALARTWQSRVFPEKSDSINAAGLVWTKAPLPMRAFAEGATIVPRNGRYLAIPTAWNRQGGRRGAKPVVTPQQMVAAKGQAFVIRSKRRSDVRIWALRAAPGGTTRRNRFAVRVGGIATVNTARRKVAELAQAQADILKRGFVPMFVLVPRVVIRRRLNVQALIEATQASLRVGLAEAIAEAASEIGARS